jgi:protein involved in polysaccharide export with SLBB domain
MASGKVKAVGLLLGACVLGVGCQQTPRWPANGFLDPSQVGRFPVQSVPQNIQSVVSIMDEPLDIAAATEPTTADLEAVYKDYVLGPGDTVRTTIMELLGEGTESTFDRQVSESGFVSIPVLGSIQLGGMSAREAEVHIADLLQPEIIRDPRVSVVILDRRHQAFEMLGGFVASGSYVIPRPSFRLLDAIAIARDIQPGIETIYVLRSYDYQEPRAAQVQSAAIPPAAIVDEGVQAPAAAGLPSEAELQGLMGLADGTAGQAPAAPRKPIYIEGQWVEVPATSSAPVATTGPAGEATDTAASVTTAEVDWAAAITEGSRQRILRIPVRDLMRGDPRFNVVIRPDDKVYAWIGPVGEFYVYGNVYRPGVFSLTGRRITVRQAIAAAGGLAPLAIPDRCELVRRYNDSQEEIIRLNLDAIFAGAQPDVVLKPNDTINVGTNALAPFMATIRNAFRMTYGFGFVYDRNFADIDSYSARENPETVNRVQRASRFGALFR